MLLKASAPTWALFGTGATKADESFDAQTSNKRYINQVSTSQNVTGYDYSVEYEYDQIPSQKAIKFIDSVAKKEEVGSGAITDLVIVSMNLKKKMKKKAILQGSERLRFLRTAIRTAMVL